MEKQPTEQIVWIVGMAYCGSSLLNVLLDSQPGFRAIGEGAKVYEKKKQGGPCTRCRTDVANCEFFRNFNGSDFYQYTLDGYPGAEVLVDSSKHAEWLVDQAQREPDFEYRALLVSKTPHEAAFSLLKHREWDHWDPDKRHTDVMRCFQSYRGTYRQYLKVLRRFFGDRFGDSVLTVRYRDVAAARIRSVQRITRWLGRAFDASRLREQWRDSSSHILGGNPSIIAQVSRDESLSFAVPPEKYLDGKYARRDGQVFIDDSWRRDVGFLQECKAAYAQDAVPDRLLSELGHEMQASQIADLKPPDRQTETVTC